MKKVMTFTSVVWLLWFATVQPCRVFAAESAVGHYSPGAMSSFIDTVPPGFAAINFFNYYNGSAGGDTRLPLGGIVASDLDVTSYADVFGLAYGTPFGILDGKFAAAVLIPYVWVDVKAQVDLQNRLFPRLGRTVSRHDTADGIGDITLIPFWLAWNKGDFKWDVRFDIYAPTGEYTEGRLANVGLNYWTFEPVVSFNYLSSKIGLEISAYAGLNFNTTNDATDYQSGDVFHLDLTVA
ncbi:MAG: transporter, partial [Syntrophobacter sp.]